MDLIEMEAKNPKLSVQNSAPDVASAASGLMLC